MGEALATRHWRISIDATDVEFVIGAPRWVKDESGVGDESESESKMDLGDRPLWILDFDCSGPSKADKSGPEAIARAFWRNDPYYLRPDVQEEPDQRLWKVFATEYKRMGTNVLETHVQEGGNIKDMQASVHGAMQRIEEWKEAR